MRAIILAAGKGSRLNGVAGDIPKCLVNIGGVPLLERQVQALRSSGIYDINVVVGYGADIVREVCGTGVNYIENILYHQTNSLFSMWIARDCMSDGFVVMNGDVLFHPQLLRNFLSFRHEDALLISYCDSEATPLGDEEMKVKINNGTIADITKTMNPKEADGENVGIGKFGPAGARLLVEKMDELIRAGARRDWAPLAFREFAFERPLSAVSTGGFPWIEIDYPEDYARALDQILPLISMDEEMAEEAVAAMSSET
ncbi:MAG TPA: phosphocholine cytidylyltransferase family protein [Blastocatellia bacterium]|nr:phosphocholine cytidylyltransferase family protein [Blastocatellia bacterium]